MIRANLVIHKGADFSTSINLEDDNGQILDLSGQQAFAQMRKHYLSESFFPFTVTIANSTLIIEMENSVTSNIEYGRYEWDLFLRNSAGIQTKLCYGRVTVVSSSTRIVIE